MRSFFIICTLSLLTSASGLFAQNPCNVQAIFSPAGDSVIVTPTGVFFENQSLNATDYRFFVDRYQEPMNTDFTTGFGVGLTKISLVAYNGQCTDTAVAYYFYAGTYPGPEDNPRRLYGYASRNQRMNALVATQNGSYLMAGKRLESNIFYEAQQGLLIKTKAEGCVEWARRIPSKLTSDVELIEESSDGGFFASVMDDYQYRIVKLDGNGDRIWTRKITFSNDRNFKPIGFEAMPDGGLVVTGTGLVSTMLTILRLSHEGDILWQREYEHDITFNNQFNRLLYKDAFIYYGGDLTTDNGTTNGSYLTKLNATSGSVVWTKKYNSNSGSFNFGNMVDVDSCIMVAITGPTGVLNTPGLGGFLRLNTDGEVLDAKLLGEEYIPNWLHGPYNNHSTQITKSGNHFYILSYGATSLNLQPGISYSYRFARIDSTYNFPWVAQSGGVGVQMFNQIAPALDGKVALGGNGTGGTLSPNLLGTHLSLRITDSSGGNENASCVAWRQAFQTIPQNIAAQQISWTVDRPASCVSSPAIIPFEKFFPEMRFICPDYVDSCSYLKISGERSICNISSNHQYKTHKNKACGQPTVWDLPADVQLIEQTDSSVSVKFPAFGRYVLYATNTLSCVPVQDSIVVIAESISPPLNLGADQEICPQNTLMLRAGPNFFSYSWQDGSTDSILQVNSPGEYWVMATDSCGNILRDTIQIALAPPIPFYAGPDRIKCNNDTIQLIAPAGFTNYTWGPGYNVISTNNETIIVNPLVDTSYTIRAEASPGCYAYDTVAIKVFHSPAINLGTDQSFCIGDSAVFNAGAGFTSYTWSTGSNSEEISAHTAGVYSVTATTADGCSSYDTVRVQTVWALPVPQLDQNPVLCEGTERILNPGNNFAAYLWNDGSSEQTLTINSTGSYSVEVTDQNGCQASVSVLVDQLIASPTGFLGADTAICSYGTVTLFPTDNFRSYTWSNGSNNSSLTVREPGEYSLEVRNEENCIGLDTILVNLKDCMKGLYVPSGFTPNGDGLNDHFKPMLFGDIKSYRFVVYNRWGNIVFQTTDPLLGWDGKYKGQNPDPAVFVWACTYQLEGLPARTEKGTVTLLK